MSATRIFLFFQTRDPTLEYFGEALQKYHSEHKDALSVPDKRPIGFLLIDAKAFKAEVAFLCKIHSHGKKCLVKATSV